MPANLGEQFRAAMRRFPSTVSVNLNREGGQRHGMTATAVTSVSLDPPSLLVCVNRCGGMTIDMMESCHRFCVNVLHAEHRAVSRNFADPNCRERFAYGGVARQCAWYPYLLDAQVAISCVKSLSVPYGSHTASSLATLKRSKSAKTSRRSALPDGEYGICEAIRPRSRSIACATGRLGLGNATFPTDPMKNSFALADFVPYLLNRAGVRIGLAFARDIEPLGVTLPMWRVMAALWESGDGRLGGSRSAHQHRHFHPFTPFGDAATQEIHCPPAVWQRRPGLEREPD